MLLLRLVILNSLKTDVLTSFKWRITSLTNSDFDVFLAFLLHFPFFFFNPSSSLSLPHPFSLFILFLLIFFLTQLHCSVTATYVQRIHQTPLRFDWWYFPRLRWSLEATRTPPLPFRTSIARPTTEDSPGSKTSPRIAQPLDPCWWRTSSDSSGCRSTMWRQWPKHSQTRPSAGTEPKSALCNTAERIRRCRSEQLLWRGLQKEQRKIEFFSRRPCQSSTTRKIKILFEKMYSFQWIKRNSAMFNIIRTTERQTLVLEMLNLHYKIYICRSSTCIYYCL